jgi:arsenical pump membrane protein
VPHLAITLVWLISLASIVLMLLRPRRIAEAWWVAGGALLLVVTGLLPLARAEHAIGEGLDVYLFLIGMMLLAEVARHAGVFDWLAGIAVAHASGSAVRLFLLIYLAGAVVTVFLSNDATAVVLTPAVLAAVRRARATPRPHLLACALIANAASFVLPISNPANLILFGGHLPPLAEWLRIFLLPSVASIAATYIVLRALLRRQLTAPVADHLATRPLTAAGKLALAAILASAGVLLIASGLGWQLGLPTAVVGVAALLVVGWRDRNVPRAALRGVSWSVLPLVAGLFMLVEALNRAGMLTIVEHALAWTARQPGLAGRLVSGFAVALLTNGMNNLPVGLASGAALAHAHLAGTIQHAVLIGVDLGPNLSVTGSLATILWLIALRREGEECSALDFLKVGLLAMPLALLASLLSIRS